MSMSTQYRRALLPRFALLVAAGLAVAACNSDAEEAMESSANGERGPVPVTYIEALPSTVEDVERTLATVEAKWSARIAAEVAATVESIAVDAGDEVTAGMVLATLDARDFEIELSRASANVRRLESTAANREREFSRQRQLAERGHVSDAALEAIEAELEGLREELAAARAEVQQAERNLGRTEVRTPHGGTVAERLVSEGDYVSSGTVLLEIPRADRLQVRIPVPETSAERLSLGLPVRLSTAAAPGRAVESTISHIQPQVAAGSRTVTVIAEIDNPGGWRPGSSVNAEVILDSRQAITLPPTSVVRRPAGNVAYVVENGIARETPVHLGQRTRGWVEVTEGLAPGDQVVVDGAGFLSDGARIDPRAHDDGANAEGVARAETAR